MSQQVTFIRRGETKRISSLIQDLHSTIWSITRNLEEAAWLFTLGSQRDSGTFHSKNFVVGKIPFYLIIQGQLLGYGTQILTQSSDQRVFSSWALSVSHQSVLHKAYIKDENIPPLRSGHETGKNYPCTPLLLQAKTDVRQVSYIQANAPNSRFYALTVIFSMWWISKLLGRLSRDEQRWCACEALGKYGKWLTTAVARKVDLIIW